jgi:phage recombination protein Bet
MMEKFKKFLPTKEQIKLMYPNISDKDMEILLHLSQKTGLDILQKQIYAVPRGNSSTIQTSIDGLRLIAERTGNYAPGKESTYEYDKDGNIIKATAYIKKRTQDGTWHDVAVSAFMSEYTAISPFWKRMPHVMLAKCSEAAALRKAFPDALSGLYAEEEMSQADKPEKVFVSEKELEELRNLINETDTDINVLTDHYGIKSLEEMPMDKYSGAIRVLKRKKAAYKKERSTNE